MADLARTEWDAIVIGAGPAGAMASLLLAREGLSTLLVERRTFPRDKICGGCLNAQAVDLLARQGVSDRIVRAGARRIDRLVLQHGAHRAELPIPPGLAISRATLDAALVGAAVDAGCTFQPQTTAQVVPLSAPASEAGRREVSLKPDPSGPPGVVRARVVVAADGLTHGSLRLCRELESRVWSRARIGLGAHAPAGTVECDAHSIRMTVGPNGYVGVVEAEGGMLNIAAAVDPAALAGPGGAAAAVSAILEGCHICPRCRLDGLDWRGTAPLTRRMVRPVGHRLLVIGDAAGYVEPFTGEGMAWALLSAEAAAPFVLEARNGWSEALERRWLRAFGRIVNPAQRRCRLVSRALRRPGLVRAAMLALHAEPRLARPLVPHVAPVIRRA